MCLASGVFGDTREQRRLLEVAEVDRRVALLGVSAFGIAALTACSAPADDAARPDDTVVIATPTGPCENGYSQLSGVTLTCDQMAAIAAPIVDGGTTQYDGITWTASNPTDDLCLFNYSSSTAVFTNNLATQAAIECENLNISD